MEESDSSYYLETTSCSTEFSIDDQESFVVIAAPKHEIILSDTSIDSETSSSVSRDAGHVKKVVQMPHRSSGGAPISLFVDPSSSSASLPSLQDFKKPEKKIETDKSKELTPVAEIAEEKTLAEMGVKPREIQPGEVEILQLHTVDISTALLRLYGQYEHPSIRIRIGSRRNLECHLLILQCYSDFFRKIDAKAYSNTCKISLPIEVVSVPAFCFIYDWMLSNENAKLTPRGIVEVYKASEYLQINELIRQCWVCFDDVDYYKEFRAFKLFLEATHFGINSLRDIMLKRITRYFLPMVARPEFLRLPREIINVILSSSSIGVNSEIEVFYAACYWLLHNWEYNEEYMLELLKNVRFQLIPLGFFAVYHQLQGNEKIKCITGKRETAKFFNASIVHCTTQMNYCNDEEAFTAISQADQRTWVFDQICSYHQNRCVVKRTLENYDNFIQYIEQLMHVKENHWESIKLL